VSQTEAEEMEKLKKKYPQLNRAPGGGSALLHKRIHKGVSVCGMFQNLLNVVTII